MQVRYADTPAQKDLKKITTERRQFRTTEYNVSAYGSPVDNANLSPPMASAGVTRMAQISAHLPQLKNAGSWKRNGSSSDNNGSVPLSLKKKTGINEHTGRLMELPLLVLHSRTLTPALRRLSLHHANNRAPSSMYSFNPSYCHLT